MPAKVMEVLPLQPTHLAHDFPLGVGDRLHRQPRIVDQHHRLELQFGLDRIERHWLRQRLDRLHVDDHPGLARLGGEIGMSTFFSRAISNSTGAVKAPSANLPCAAPSSFSPLPSAMPKEKLRDCGLEQVKIKSPSPDKPVIVSGLAP